MQKSRGQTQESSLAAPVCTKKCNTLPRFERQLHLLPGWLRWMETFKTVRALAGFGVQFWYYAQLYALGHTGKTDLGMSVFAAMQQVNAMNKKLLAGRTR